MSKKVNPTEQMVEDVEVLKDVDELAKQFKIDSSAFAGIKMLMGWKKGKQLTEEEFKKAIQKFNKKSC